MARRTATAWPDQCDLFAAEPAPTAAEPVDQVAAAVEAPEPVAEPVPAPRPAPSGPTTLVCERGEHDRCRAPRCACGCHAAPAAAAEDALEAEVAELVADAEAAESDQSRADRARRLERLLAENARLEAAAAEHRAAQERKRATDPELRDWCARFTRRHKPVQGIPTNLGFECPSCGYVAANAGLLRNECGYDPDRPGEMPHGVAGFGEPGCHRQRAEERQARGAAQRAEAAAGVSVEPVAEAEPTADDAGRAWLDARYAGWVARQERRAEADTAEHAEPEPDEADEDQDDHAAEAHAAREVETWRATFRRHDGWRCPSCHTTEPTEDALREHGYNPDQPGTMPPGVTIYGETNRCHLAPIDQPAPQLGPEHAAVWPAHNAGWMTHRHGWAAIVTDERGRGVAIIAAPACDGPRVEVAPDGALF